MIKPVAALTHPFVQPSSTCLEHTETDCIDRALNILGIMPERTVRLRFSRNCYVNHSFFNARMSSNAFIIPSPRPIPNYAAVSPLLTLHNFLKIYLSWTSHRCFPIPTTPLSYHQSSPLIVTDTSFWDIWTLNFPRTRTSMRSFPTFLGTEK